MSNSSFVTEFCPPKYIYLVSKCNLKERFAIPIDLLAKGSPVFRGMLQVPRGLAEHELEDRANDVDLDEDGLTLAFLSAYLCGTEVKASVSGGPSTLANVITCADKYNVDGLVEYVKAYTSAFWDSLAKSPVDLYILIQEQGWWELEWKAFQETLKVNIEQPEFEAKLGRLGASRAKQIRKLHKTRVQFMVDLFCKGFMWSDRLILKRPVCLCGSEVSFSEFSALIEFQSHIACAIQRRPLGDFLWNRQYWEREESSLKEKACQRCHQSFFDAEKIMEKLRSSSFWDEFTDARNVL